MCDTCKGRLLRSRSVVSEDAGVFFKKVHSGRHLVQSQLSEHSQTTSCHNRKKRLKENLNWVQSDSGSRYCSGCHMNNWDACHK